MAAREVPLANRRFDRVANWVFVVSCLVAVGILIAIPAYANYDSIYSLVWAREIFSGQLPSFDGYRAPTEHPLWLAVSLLLEPFGDSANRLIVGVTVLSVLA